MLLSIFCSAIFIASDILYISASNISLFLPKVIFCICQLLFLFHITVALVSPWSSLDPLHHKAKSARFSLAILIALFFSSIEIFPGKICNSIVETGSIPSGQYKTLLKLV